MTSFCRPQSSHSNSWATSSNVNLLWGEGVSPHSKTEFVIDRILAKFEKFLDLVTSVILAGLLLIVWAQVVSRYVLNSSLPWTEEAARYLMIWGVLLGVNLAFLNGYLISINFITDKLPERVQAVMGLVRKLCALFYTGILAYYGVFLAIMGARMESPAMGIQYTWVFAAVPIGAALLFVLFLLRKV